MSVDGGKSCKALASLIEPVDQCGGEGQEFRGVPTIVRPSQTTLNNVSNILKPLNVFE